MSTICNSCNTRFVPMPGRHPCATTVHQRSPRARGVRHVLRVPGVQDRCRGGAACNRMFAVRAWSTGCMRCDGVLGVPLARKLDQAQALGAYFLANANSTQPALFGPHLRSTIAGTPGETTNDDSALHRWGADTAADTPYTPWCSRACGWEPWPPRPVMTISKKQAWAITAPGFTAKVPRFQLGQLCHLVCDREVDITGWVRCGGQRK